MMDNSGANHFSGLTRDEIHRRRLQFGFNEIKKKGRQSPLRLFLGQFKSPLVLILIVACLISFFLHERIEALSIGAVLLINAVIGFFQEYRAENAIVALQKMTAPRSLVIRDGHQTMIFSRELVPGDILLLESGDIVGADGKILESSHLQLNESLLTGESLPVTKSKGDDVPMVFMGTTVVTGTATIEITGIGMQTEIGKIAHLITTAKIEPTPLQTQLALVGKYLLIICGFVFLVAIILGFFRGIAFFKLMMFAMSLAVAAVPEGLPAIVTVALALGVRKLARENALIRKLPVVEALGSVSVICTDKTGTLTTGDMRLCQHWGDDLQALIKAAASCCDAELADDGVTGSGDSTEVAILIAARENGILKADIERKNPRVSTEPFDPQKKRMSILRQDGNNYIKGAVESVLPFCRLDDKKKRDLFETADIMSSRGLRLLAVAIGRGAGEHHLDFLGLLGFADPPRPEAISAIQQARSAGIIPVMITGDHPQTATAVAREMGLVLDDDSIEERVHARATPEDKLQLVRRWKEKGAIVAMTGDGVNDAPALREAHVGIAMGIKGTEVTRQTADFILADDNFATIVVAIREGRGIFQNIRKSIAFLLSGNLAELSVVLGTLLFNFPLPLLASHLLWINLVTDSLPALTLVTDPPETELMNQKPRSPTEKILGQREWLYVIAVGLFEAFVMLWYYHFLLKSRGEAVARNLIFPAIVFSQIFRAFSARSFTQSFLQVGLLNNLWLLGVFLLTTAVQLSLHYIPLTQNVFGLQSLSAQDLLTVFGISIVTVGAIEVTKLIFRILRH